MSEWDEVTLGSLTSRRKGITYKSEHYSADESGHPFITIKCFVKGGGYDQQGLKHYEGPYATADKLKAGDILFAVTDLTRAGDIVGSPLRVPDFGGGKPPLASMDCMRIDPIKNLCDAEFLYHRMMLSDVRRQMVAFSAGSTVLHLDVKKVSSLILRVPVRTETQRAIAKILGVADQAIEKTEALIEKYQQIKAGLMHDLFTRGIGPDGNLRPPREQAPELYQETPIGWIPKEWGLPNLGIHADIRSGVTLGSKPTPDQKISVPYLRVANVQDGYLDLAEVKEIKVNQKTLDALRLLPGDVLMNEGGDYDKLGRGTVWQGQIDPCIHQNHVFRVRVNREIFRPYFLAFWSQSEFGKKYFVLSSKQSTNLASINSTQLHAFPVAMPSMEEQEAIEYRIASVNARIESLEAETRKLVLRKTGLMHDLLTGKVPVSPDPPEPADV